MNTSTAPKISPRWQQKFAILEKLKGNTDLNREAGAFSMSPAAIGRKNGGEKVGFKEGFWFICWPAFFFGFLWYFFQGMWKKGLVLVGISLALGTLIELLPFGNNQHAYVGVGMAYSVFVGRMATVDMYRKLKLGGFNNWF